MKKKTDVSFQEKVEEATDIIKTWEPCAMSWEYFMIYCAGWSSVPVHTHGKRRSLQYREYVAFRLQLIYAINLELANRMDCRRLAAWKDDNKKPIVKWMSTSESVPYVLMKQFKRITNTNAKTIQRCNKLSAAKNIKKNQIVAVRRIKRNTETNHMKASMKLVAAMAIQPTKTRKVKQVLPSKKSLK